ncbi:hypothetical protein DL96DRAFT_1716227 [Flagelloscypha sp. PMI_526]|nr:hypothetical protein DL96DRAFT_1716227 [Flagelloscypha sp. PMI_526]
MKTATRRGTSNNCQGGLEKRDLPSLSGQSREAYGTSVLKVKAGHVAPDTTINQPKERLSLLRGTLTEAPLMYVLVEIT